MRCKLHLISMPWANPELPSIQIATLEAYVNSTFGKKVPTQSYGEDAILIRDGRYGEVKEYHLYDDRARICNLSHQGPTLASLKAETGLSDAVIEKHLAWLIARKLLVKLDGFYISRALRSRDELVQNCHEKMALQTSVLRMQPRPSLPIYSDTQVAAG